jgi:hypothetical protein
LDFVAHPSIATRALVHRAYRLTYRLVSEPGRSPVGDSHPAPPDRSPAQRAYRVRAKRSRCAGPAIRCIAASPTVNPTAQIMASAVKDHNSNVGIRRCMMLNQNHCRARLKCYSTPPMPRRTLMRPPTAGSSCCRFLTNIHQISCPRGAELGGRIEEIASSPGRPNTQGHQSTDTPSSAICSRIGTRKGGRDNWIAPYPVRR